MAVMMVTERAPRFASIVNLMKVMNSTGIMTQNGTETRMHASGPPVSFLLLSFGFQSVSTQGADSLS